MRRPRTKPLQPVPAAIRMLADQFASRPYGGFHGERLRPTPAEPPPPPAPPFQIPRWSEEERRQAMQPEPEEPNGRDVSRPSAHAEWDPGPPDLGPPIELAPLPRYTIPEPDWRLEAEEREAAERAAARKRRSALLEELLAEDVEAYPKAKKP